jgi:hypothetical protein
MRAPAHLFVARLAARKRMTLLMLLVLIGGGMLASGATLA